MDFDQMLETWRAQKTAPPYDVNREALRQVFQTEHARIRRELRIRRWVLGFLWILGTGMAVWAAFWIAITITNGWPVIYAISAGVSSVMFAFGVWALWVSRAREPERDFGNTLEEEVRRSLALVDYQLSNARRLVMFILGAASISVTSMLFFWTLNRSQGIPDSSFPGYGWSMVGLAAWFGWAFYKTRNATPKLELRQRQLREVLAALDASE